MKNRIWKQLVALGIATGLLAGCGNQAVKSENTVDNSQKAKAHEIVCTIFPEYDWVREIIKGKESEYDLTMLLDNGTDLHSYQPTADDVAKIAKCDLFIYVGGESDGWVEDALKESVNPDMQVIDLLDVLGDSVKEEELVEGMEAEEEEEEGEEEGPEYDEHVWLSLKNAKLYAERIEQALEKIDAGAKDVYAKNLTDYKTKLDSLDQEYEKAVSEADHKTLLFGDRFPFRYLVDDYGLDYYAAFVGCSAETEASFETIVFLSQKMDDLGLSHVLTIENSDQKIAKTIIENTKKKDQKIDCLDSMQSVTGKDVQQGETYLGIMEQNLKVLKQVL